MRALAILAAALVAAAALSGCIGGLKDDDPVTPAGAAGDGAPTGNDGGSLPTTLTVLNALNASITFDAPAWIQSGTQVPVNLSAPANAKGDLTYAWAIGPVPGTVAVTAAKADTGSSKGADYIAPGEAKSITFVMAGVYRLHCHPHPDMRHNVTVIEGYDSPRVVEVAIFDGEKQNEYRYVPENIVVGVNTTVNYKNVGQQPHSATALPGQEPSLEILPLTEANGTITVDGEGWQRIVAVFTDSEGRLGIAEKAIYATAELPSFKPETKEFTFAYGASQLSGTAAAPAAKSEPVTLAHGGLVFLNYTFTDAASPSGASPAAVEVHFTKDGETQDTMTGGGASDTLSGKALPGAYTLKVVPVTGAQIEGTVTIEVIYDLVPPPPTSPGAAEEGHGGHAH